MMQQYNHSLHYLRVSISNILKFKLNRDTSALTKEQTLIASISLCNIQKKNGKVDHFHILNHFGCVQRFPHRPK